MKYEFDTEFFDLVNNPEYSFYKLYINGKCQFDEFYAEISHIKKDMDSMKSIIRLMDMYSDTTRLPDTKFRQVKNIGRPDVFEFKKDAVRVYVVLQKPNIYIVMGGHKNTQNKDIKNLKSKLSGFEVQPEEKSKTIKLWTGRNC